MFVIVIIPVVLLIILWRKTKKELEK
jgi:hypothetical protein